MDPLQWESTDIHNVSKLPWAYGCYAFICKAKIMYIGRSKMLHNRVNDRHQKLLMLDRGAVLIAWNTEVYDREKELIQLYNPPLNISHVVSSVSGDHVHDQ